MRNLFDTRDRDVMPRYSVTGMRLGRVLSPSRLSCAGMAARRSLRSGAGPSDAESRCGEPRPSPRPGEGGVNSHRSKRWYHFTARPHRTPRIR